MAEFKHDFIVPTFTSIGPDDCTEKIYLVQKPDHFDYLHPKGFIFHETLPTRLPLSKKDIEDYLKKDTFSQDVVPLETLTKERSLVEEDDKDFLSRTKTTIPLKHSYKDVVARKHVLNNTDLQKIIENQIHEEIFPTWLR